MHTSKDVGGASLNNGTAPPPTTKVGQLWSTKEKIEEIHTAKGRKQKLFHTDAHRDSSRNAKEWDIFRRGRDFGASSCDNKPEETPGDNDRLSSPSIAHPSPLLTFDAVGESTCGEGVRDQNAGNQNCLSNAEAACSVSNLNTAHENENCCKNNEEGEAQPLQSGGVSLSDINFNTIWELTSNLLPFSDINPNQTATTEKKSNSEFCKKTTSDSANYRPVKQEGSVVYSGDPTDESGERSKVRFSESVDVHVYRSEAYFKRFKFKFCCKRQLPDEHTHFVMPHPPTCDADENPFSRSTSLEKMPISARKTVI